MTASQNRHEVLADGGYGGPMTAAADLLAERFGFADFRPGQQQVIDALLAGRSALAVFPTGGGKSLCYQLPALLLDGVTVVVSPLIALMKDQIDFLARQRHRRGAARLEPRRRRGARGLASGCATGALKLALRRAGALQQRALPRAARAARGSRSSPSTRRTASRSGATTSGPTT